MERAVLTELSVDSYNKLRDVESWKKQSDISTILDSFRKLFIDHDLQEHIGIGLLHRHLHLGNDMCVVEKPVGSNCSIIELRSGYKKKALQGDILPCSWSISYNSDKKEYCYHPIEFIEVQDDTTNVCKVIANVLEKREFLREFAELAHSFEVQDLIGLVVIYRDHFTIGESEMLLESPNSESSLRIDVVPSVSMDMGSVIQTTWSFALSPVTRGCWYVRYCRADRRGHLSVGGHT